MHHIVGVLTHPRSTMAALVAAPAFWGTWIFILLVWMACAWALLGTEVGQQALVDERVRVTEVLGGRIDDAAYAALQARPPLTSYVTSGGRLLLTPPMTVLAALAVAALARSGGRVLNLAAAMAIAVHASVVLAVQQVVAAPLHYLRESLGSPTTLASILPGIEDGTWAARVLGVIDVFALWWLWLLAVGVAAATGRPARRYGVRLVAVYMGVAVLMAVVVAIAGGS
jgi:hypothetical protein